MHETQPIPESEGPLASSEDGFERYRVIRSLGLGGMGEVLLAHDPGLRREVALKVVRHEGAMDEEGLGRFVQEAQVTGQLEHPNIIGSSGMR